MSRLKDDFVKEARKVNSHFERFFKSSLRPIMKILDRFPDQVIPFMPVQANSPNDINDLANAIQRLSTSKKNKYKNALAWLEGRVAGLKTVLSGDRITTGQTTVGYIPGKEVRRKDKDNRWHNFYLQQKGNSCGPTCVRTIIKAHTHIKLPSEQYIRDQMGLVERGQAHTGLQVSGHDWENVGSNVPSILQVLISIGIRDARTVVGTNAIRRELFKCSKNNPGIIGWWWGPAYGVHDADHSGHWTACVGPTENQQEFVLLDPWEEVQYVRTNQFWEYRPSTGGFGWFDPDAIGDPAVIVTHPK